MKLSVCIPSIRTENIPALYASLQESVVDLDFELIIVTPFDVPVEIKDKVRVIKDRGCPKIGGFDCSIEHCNYSLHDLCYRLQTHGGSKLHLSPSFILNCDWNPSAKEYQCINHANDHDWRIFRSFWKRPTDRFRLDFDNWKNAPDHWRRFNE